MHNIVKWALLLVVFAPMFYFALSKKKWYLYLACGFVGIFPDHFAISLSSSLPLLTGTRIVLLILFGFWLYQWFKKERKSWPLPIALLVYGGILLVVSFFNFRYGVTNEIKGLFILVFEKILLATMIRDLVKDRQELNHCLDTLILATFALAVIGIVQTIFGHDLTSVLKLAVPRTSQALPGRMGMVRAFGTSNAIAFGCHLSLVSLLTYYRLERTGKQRYSLILGTLLTALICTFSRSSWLVFAATVGVLFCTRPLKLLKRSWVSLVVTVVMCLSLTFLNANFGNAIKHTGYSCLNTALRLVNIELPEPTIAEDETVIPTESTEETDDGETDPSDSTDPSDTSDPSDPSEDPTDESTEPLDEIINPEPPSFGPNQHSAVHSRTIEWTALDYMLQQGRGAFGYGYNAFGRGKIRYYYPAFGYWTRARTLDVGLLRITMDHGLVGLVAFLGFVAYLIAEALRKVGKKGIFTFNKLMLFVLPMFLMLNYAAAYTGSFWTIVGLLFASQALDKNGCPDEEPEPPYSLRRF